MTILEAKQIAQAVAVETMRRVEPVAILMQLHVAASQRRADDMEFEPLAASDLADGIN